MSAPTEVDAPNVRTLFHQGRNTAAIGLPGIGAKLSQPIEATLAANRAKGIKWLGMPGPIYQTAG
jgi:hypothetical protein